MTYHGIPGMSMGAHFALDIYIHTGYTHGVSIREAEIEDLLPLPEATFHTLVAVAEDDRHGYAIRQNAATGTVGALKLSPGTLYRSIQRMLEQGLIQEAAERPAPELDDERRRSYRITSYGSSSANRSDHCGPGGVTVSGDCIAHTADHESE